MMFEISHSEKCYQWHADCAEQKVTELREVNERLRRGLEEAYRAIQAGAIRGKFGARFVIKQVLAIRDSE